MKKLLGLLAFVMCLGSVSVGAQAATKEINRGGCVDRFILTDTVNPAFEGYRVFVMCGANHKIVYQESGADKTTRSDFCNVEDELDVQCFTLNPGPVYEEWDNATQVSGDDLSPATKRLLIWAWVYEMHVKKAMKSAEVEIETQSGYNPPDQRRASAGAFMGWGLDFLDAKFCGDLQINGPGVCTYEETGLLHVTARIKRLVRDLDNVVLDLP